ncbi:hypothetical protein BDZ97DRAFT_1914974 [Flammula alnicola]|nr:hypothetical protein BDZ97DRAFT_1914974 [Flammula alnicola]
MVSKNTPIISGSTYAPTAATAPRIYDPNDPSTFPTNDHSGFNPYTPSPDSFAQQQQYPGQVAQHITGHSTSGAFPQMPGRPQYTGAPEL